MLLAAPISFWNTTIAGGIYGLLTSSIIFFLTTLFNGYSQKKNIEREMFRAFIESNADLMHVLEDGNRDTFDYMKIRNATLKMHTLYLKEGEIRTMLDDLVRIHLLSSDSYRVEKNKIPNLIKKLYKLIKQKRDELL